MIASRSSSSAPRTDSSASRLCGGSRVSLIVCTNHSSGALLPGRAHARWAEWPAPLCFALGGLLVAGLGGLVARLGLGRRDHFAALRVDGHRDLRLQPPDQVDGHRGLADLVDAA